MAVILLLIYLLPTIIALCTSKRNWLAITVLNVLLGFTIIGWVVALIWSLTKDK